VLSGDFDRAEAMRQIERYFGPIPRGKTEIVRPTFDEPELGAERREVITDEPVPLPAIFYAYRIPPEGSKDYMALDLLTDILASGQSSRLYKKLIYEMQVASEVSAYVDGREMPGLAYLYGIAREPDQSVESIEQAIAEVVDELIANGVDPAELEKAQNKTEARHIVSRVTVQGKADQLAHAAIFYKDTSRVNSVLAEYRSITVEDVQSAARKYLQPSNRATILYVPAEVEEEVAADA
jgi:predicted Zn-dependent peptidase